MSEIYDQLAAKHRPALRERLARAQVAPGIDSGNSVLGRIGHGFRRGGAGLFNIFNPELSEDPLGEAQQQVARVADTYGVDPTKLAEDTGNKQSTGLMIAEMGGSLAAELPQYIAGGGIAKRLLKGTGVAARAGREAATFGAISAAHAPEGERVKAGLHGAALGGAFGAIGKGVEPIESKIGQRLAAGAGFGGVAAADELITTGDVTATNVGLQSAFGALVHSPHLPRTKERLPISEGGTPKSFTSGESVSAAPKPGSVPPGSADYVPSTTRLNLRTANPLSPGERPPQYATRKPFRTDEMELAEATARRTNAANAQAAARQTEQENFLGNIRNRVDEVNLANPGVRVTEAGVAPVKQSEVPLGQPGEAAVKPVPTTEAVGADLQRFREQHPNVHPETGLPEVAPKPVVEAPVKKLTPQQRDALHEAQDKILEQMENTNNPRTLAALREALIKVEAQLNGTVPEKPGRPGVEPPKSILGHSEVPPSAEGGGVAKGIVPETTETIPARKPVTLEEQTVDSTPQVKELVEVVKPKSTGPQRDPKGRFVSPAKAQAQQRGELYVDKDNPPRAEEIVSAMDCSEYL